MTSQEFISGLKMCELAQTTALTASDNILVGTTAGNKYMKASDTMFAMLDAFGAPELHRMVFRRKNLGTALTAEQKTNIQNGTFKGLWLGDYLVINGVNIISRGDDMDQDYISRAEHEEFRRFMEAENKRLEDENDRQNHRLNTLEDTVKQVAAISTSTEKLALNMENMLKEQVSQGKRLETLENRDGEMWRKVVGYVVTAIAGIFVGYIFKKFGM